MVILPGGGQEMKYFIFHVPSSTLLQTGINTGTGYMVTRSEHLSHLAGERPANIFSG